MLRFELSPEERMLENILNGLDADSTIYRVLSVERFFEMVDQKMLVLVKPGKWDDPFEDLLSNTKVVGQDGEKIGFAVTNNFYGQCWTLKKESDGIWRNYASLTRGVRIQTTVKKLLNAIYNVNDEWSGLHCFIGKVMYKTDSEIKKDLKGMIDQILLNRQKEDIVKTLLIKRDEFDYEEEVRLLFSDKNKSNNSIASFPITPLSLIDSVLFAPKTSKYIFEIFKEKVKNYGFSEEKVAISKLYEPFSIEFEHELL